MDFLWLTSRFLQRALWSSRMMRIADSKYRWKTIAKKWLLVTAWAGLIFYFSTDQFSSLNTGEIFRVLLSWLFLDMPIEDIEPLHGSIRKLGHWGEYFILSVLFLWALQKETERKWKLRQAVHTLIFVLLYAVGDEFHQSFIPSRTASVGDVMINAVGGICGISWTYGSIILATLTSRTKTELKAHQARNDRPLN
jgi:VanZ family protein